MKGSVSAKTLKGALNSPQSVSGKAVPRGLDGVSPTVDLFDIEDGHRVVITDIAGPKTFDVKDGKDGEDGYTPVKGVDYFDGEGVYIAEVSESAESRGSNVVIFSNGTKLNIMNGKDGEDGTGVSVVSVTESTKEGGANVVTFSDGTKLTVMNGTKGADGTMTFEELTPEQKASLKGDRGDRGEKGDSGVYVGDGDMPEGYNVQIIPDGTPDYDPGSGTGESGATFIPSVSEDGVISWTNDKGLSNPDPVDISGKDGKDGIDGYTPIKDVDYFDGKDGKDGTSVTVSKVTESTADGGSNVVTFSDGKTLTVKNGTKGSKGDKGDTYTLTSADKVEIRDEVISSVVTQEAGQSTNLVMSQKAVTDLVADAIGSGGGGTSTEYETVDSVEEMTDTSKQYVLKETGTIWAYGEKEVEKEPENKLVPSKATLNQRLSGSSASVSGSSPGSFVTDFIAVPNMDSISPYNVRLNWEMALSGDNKVVYFNSSKTRVGNTTFANSSIFHSNTTVSNGETVIDIKKADNGSTDAPNGNWADIAYIRLQLFVKPVGTSITSADIADKTITFDHEGGTTIINEWYDTGLTPSASGGGGGNYVELLVKVNQNKTDIEEVSNRVTALETGSDTVTVPTFWQSAVDVCISKIKALQVGKNCVTFPFFSDNHQRNGQPQYMGMLIAHIMKECNIPYCFFGGDSISNGIIADEATMIAQDKAFDTAMSYVPNGRFCRAVGNHDGFWNDGTNKYYYNRDQVYDLFLREESIAQNKHFGDDGTYYYIDDIASKVRWIVMDTNGGSVDSTQIAWVQNTALNITESGWGVVFISHQPICNAYHSGITNAANVISAVTSTASSKNLPIIGWYSGHVHRDRIYTKLLTGGNGSNAGTPTTDLGFTQVVITSDHTGIAYDNDDGTVSDTKHTIANDDKSHAIDFVTINKTTRTVSITRLGIGSDRSYTY